MATTKYCPICYSEISETNTPDPENFIWSDDPILTYDGYNFIDDEGNPTTDPSAIGFCQIFLNHIIELQDNRKALEANILSKGDRTDFSAINSDGIFLITAKHIAELRWSTEKILNITGQTKEEYFNYNVSGVDQRPGNHQMDWTDPLPRTTSDPENYNNNYTFDFINHYLENDFQLKGIHIADLRHYVLSGWIEDWVGLNNLYIGDQPGHLAQYTGRHSWDTIISVDGASYAKLQIYNRSDEEEPPDPPLLYWTYVIGGGNYQSNSSSIYMPIFKPNTTFTITGVEYSAINPGYTPSRALISVRFRNDKYLQYIFNSSSGGYLVGNPFGGLGKADVPFTLSSGTFETNLYADYVYCFGVYPDIIDENFDLKTFTMVSQSSGGTFSFKLGRISIIPKS